MKSLLKILGLSIGCSCTAMPTQQTIAELAPPDVSVKAFLPEDELPEASPLSRLQDIGAIHAL